MPESLHKKLLVIQRRSTLILEQLSDQRKQQRANTLSKLHREPASIELQAYFKRLEEGSVTWDIDTFVKGARLFADLSGPGRAKYYNNSLKGLHYPNSFTKLWNEKYRQEPITLWDQNIRRQCPSSWSNGLGQAGCFLSHRGDGTLSQGLNHLLQGPTTLDCGMFCQLLLWMAIRYVIGDGRFDKLFNFEKGQFNITPSWENSLLEPFYDHPLHSLQSQSRIRIKTFYNHPKYLAKHPGGEEQLQNVIQIDADNITFDPTTSQNVLLATELEHSLMQGYNDPRDFADYERLWIYTADPNRVHPDFAPKNYGTLAKEAEEYVNHTLNESEWEESRDKREHNANGLHQIFNFERLLACLKNEDAHVNECINVLSRARMMKMDHLKKFMARLQLESAQEYRSKVTLEQ